MGWFSSNIAQSEIKLNDLLQEIGEKIQNAEAASDGSIKIKITVNGKNEETIDFAVSNPNEIVDMIKLNML